MSRSVVVVTFGPVGDPISGMTVRARDVVQSMARLGFDVHVVSTAAEETPIEGATVRSVPADGKITSNLAVRRGLRSLTLDRPMVIVESGLLLPGVLLSGVRRSDLILDTNECEVLHYLRRGRRLADVLRTIAWYAIELTGALVCTRVVAISEGDASAWRRLYPNRQKVVVIPHRSAIDPAGRPDPVELAQLPDVCFVGHLGAKQNAEAVEWLCTTLAPQLAGHGRLILLGKGTQALDAPDAGIVGLGVVDDLAPHLARARVCLAPVRSVAGTPTKILDYLGSGARILATPVAASQLRGAPGLEEVELNDMANRVIELCATASDVQSRRDLQRAQVGWLGAHHSASLNDAAWQTVLGNPT
jgi:hypothetical protein